MEMHQEHLKKILQNAGLGQNYTINETPSPIDKYCDELYAINLHSYWKDNKTYRFQGIFFYGGCVANCPLAILKRDSIIYN